MDYHVLVIIRMMSPQGPISQCVTLPHTTRDAAETAYMALYNQIDPGPHVAAATGSTRCITQVIRAY